jgi:hypothetical protein
LLNDWIEEPGCLFINLPGVFSACSEFRFQLPPNAGDASKLEDRMINDMFFSIFFIQAEGQYEASPYPSGGAMPAHGLTSWGFLDSAQCYLSLRVNGKHQITPLQPR